MMSSGIVPSPRKQCSLSTFAWLFPANRPLVWCHSLGSHILAFHNSVRLPSLREESIYIEVNKLQVMKPNQVWHHTPATSRDRLSSSHAFQLVAFPYDESICWQTIRPFAAKKLVQITVSVLHHILVKGENLTWMVSYFLLVASWPTSLKMVAVTFLNYW